MRRLRRCWRLALVCVAAACTGRDAAPGDSAGGREPESAVQLPALKGFGKARPVDEAAKNPAFHAFRDTLLKIVARRDSAALHARIAPTVKYSFGDSEGGADGLFRYWRQYESMDKLWATLHDVLTHGGRLTDPDAFYAPWTAGPVLPDSLDAFEHLVVRDSNVVVRATPNTADSGFGTLSYDIVRAVGDRSDSLWRGIALPDGRAGYVESRHIRSPVEWRMGFRRYGSRWLIDFFVAGD